MTADSSPWQAARSALASLPPPVVIFNKSHSGSRLLAELVANSGVFLGAHQNESHDSEDVLQLVEYLVNRYYPDYAPLWQRDGEADGQLADLVRDVFSAHLQGSPLGAPWGWKLCETAYILPIVDFLFPQARYLHLLRDGRDVAFCDHTSPEKSFWRKIYFNTDRIEQWRNLRLDNQAYDERPHLYNALHWVNSVTVGRTYGAMLRERYLEIRYEDLCRDFPATAARALDFIGAPRRDETIAKMRGEVRLESIGKFQRRPASELRDVTAIEKSLLLSLGYLTSDPNPPPPRSLKRRIKAMFGRQPSSQRRTTARP